ncbi:MAG: alpha/beta fold hydrolase [Saprospiraceae bacterium]|nr:MAG: alpha/beta hydrolase fold protein [Bacteroidetes bacterium OLB9]MCO6464604.1 alpha/beta fold hydrolase [Saprospiraceae bacterium]MCZ2336630.1 alpha/beta hydrolase [Chitinophagales bacterium]
MNMKSDFHHVETTVDVNSKIYHTIYTPEAVSVKGTVLILHGMQEHSGRYDALARFLTEHGYAVLTYDHPGHGRTAGNNDNMGFFQKHNPTGFVLNVAKAMATKLEQHFPDVPHFILGHSMGSFITRCLLQEESHRFRAAVIVGTGGKMHGATIAKNYLKMLNSLRPAQRSWVLNNVFSKMNNMRFSSEPGGDSTSWLSLSKTNREDFTSDPMNGVPFTYNGFYGLMSFVDRATRRDWAKSISHDFPFLFISGAQDPIGDFGKGVKTTVAHLQKDGFNDITLHLYPEMRHEILNEDIKQEVFERLLAWLENHL